MSGIANCPDFPRNKGMLRAFCSDWDGGELLPELEREEIHHLVRVRRVRTGETVEILNGKGDLAKCTIGPVDKKSLELTVEERIHRDPSPLRRHLLVAFPKGKTISVLLQKAVELGVEEITPLLTENSEVAPERAEQKKDRLEAILIEAVKQSGNLWIPRLNPAQSLSEVLKKPISDGQQRLCAALQPDAKPLRAILEQDLQATGTVEVYVGPEGDFSPEEYALLRESGCCFASLGPLVLRVETAASLIMGTLGIWSEALPD